MFSVPVRNGALGGWLTGTGPEVLLLHGGPGLSNEYLDGLGEEIGDGYRVAAFQQRGLAPSTTAGPFDVAQAVEDVVAVIEHLGWDKAVVVGHSWGGHLAFHLAVAASHRVRAALAIDPLGAVGDGGAATFGAEMLARTPEDDHRRAHDLDEKAMRGEGTPEDAIESFALMWPAYFPTRAMAPPPPKIRMSLESYLGLSASLVDGLPALQAGLAAIEVPVGVLVGAQSPMPADQAGGASARAIPGAWAEVIEGAGHLPWLDRPGCVRHALGRLVAPSSPPGA